VSPPIINVQEHIIDDTGRSQEILVNL